ncbi:hypothetical protein RFM51_17605 [Mesorhizobium sp. VK3E]|uniref:Transposase n=1 Tax=Mesorhizobium australafricanum TaxID=3072311 RepID=A0ABU4X2F0_9HYPH|nr:MULTISPECIES: hypothetical protein [unclassified Mesorhizobium]MDX8441410.1 hypothetical protein [Mesorhizobium sp. VK3E]MDX8455185.1 hypothetical protein [Mesorhizobium sp. VK9D]
MAISIFLKLSFRDAKTVPEVTVKTALQTLSEHLKRPRLIAWQRSVPHFGQYGSPSVSGQRIFLNQPWAVSSRTLARSMTVSVRHSGDSRKCCPFGCCLDFATAQSLLGLEGGWAAYFQASGRDRDVQHRGSRLRGDKGDGEWDGGHVQAPGCMRTASAAATGPPTKSKLYVGRPEHGSGSYPEGRQESIVSFERWLIASNLDNFLMLRNIRIKEMNYGFSSSLGNSKELWRVE